VTETFALRSDLASFRCEFTYRTKRGMSSETLSKSPMGAAVELIPLLSRDQIVSLISTLASELTR